MGEEKRLLVCVFRPDKIKSTREMRELFSGSYPRFLEMEGVEYKCWWCDQERGVWGAFYVFTSSDALEAYVNSDVWRKVVPEKYGCTPSWTVVEPGPILSKKIITTAEGSWVGD